MWFEFIVIVSALVLIYVLYNIWNKSRSVEQEYYLASDVYNKLLTNDNNPFNLMTDFSIPVETGGPEGEPIGHQIETYDLGVISQLRGS
jgi:hypothetical protein